MIIAFLAAVGVGLFSLAGFQPSIGCPVNRCPGNPIIEIGQASCVLTSGFCNVSLLNEGSTSDWNARTIACDMNVISGTKQYGTITVTQTTWDTSATHFQANVTTITLTSGTITTWHIVNGTNGGRAATSIPAGGSAFGNCTISLANLTHETLGATANGCFAVEFVNGTGRIPYYCFQTTWS